MKLKTKFALLLAVVFVAALAANIAWTDSVLHQQMERELQERGQVIALQMKQTWNYLVESSDPESAEVASYYVADPDNNCAVAGREISITFTDSSGYVTRYVNDSPRNPADEPDAFEHEALALFRGDGAPDSYFEVTDYEGVQVFRYTEPMEITEICLDCHGGPKGEIDRTGYEKEGLELGDVAGAVSIVVPMDAFVQDEQAGVFRNVAIFAVLLVVVLVIVYLGLMRLVTRPLALVQGTFTTLGEGDFDARVTTDLKSYEMNDLAASINHSAELLAKAYANLEEQVQDRTAQLQQVNEELEQANVALRNENRYKSDFLNIVSHELRTPLTSILAFAELLKDSDELDERGETARREIEANSRVLLLMINDILEMSRLDAGRMQLAADAVDVYDLIGFVESVVAPIARKSEVSFETSADPRVPVIQGDFDKLAHALENLAFNAVKFTPQGGSVRIHASYDDERDEVRIAVSDTGIGIAPEDQERVFERFAQVDPATTRRFNGTGLGLPLARNYAQLHGGRIELESEVDRGSTFTVVLPANGSALDEIALTEELGDGQEN